MEEKDEKLPDIKPTEKEKKQLILQRKIGYGRVTIFLENGQPVRVEEGIKSTKL